METGNKRVIVSANVEFNSDQMTILNCAEKNGGWITFTDLRAKMPNFNNKDRFQKSIDELLMNGLGWEDEQPLFDENNSTNVLAKGHEDANMVYWFPQLMKEQ